MPDRVIFAPAANTDLESIRQWIAKKGSPLAAETFAMRLVDRCLRLGGMPRQGRRRPEFGERVRSVAYGSYVVLYETGPEQVTILRIVHGARDLTALSLLRPEGD